MRTQLTQIKPSSTPAEVEIFVVPVSQLNAALPEIRAWLLTVEADWRIEDVEKDLREGKAQAWGARDTRVRGFWITRIEESFGKTYGLVWICAGDVLERGLDLYRETIEPWFKSKGCEWIEINGRKGWKKVLPDYEEVSIRLRKML